MSPSCVCEKPYGRDCDLWSVGVVTYLLLCGRYPFNGETLEQVADKIVSGVISMDAEEWKTVSPEAKEFVRMLLVDPWLDRRRVMQAEKAAAELPKKAGKFGRRSSSSMPKPARVQPRVRFASAAEALQHPWIKNGGPKGAGLLATSVRDSLYDLHRRNLVDTAVANMLANRMRKKDLDVLGNQFDLLDMNGDGHVSLDEYVQSMSSLHVTVDDLKRQFDSHDLNKDNKISKTEFLTACVSTNKAADADMRELFDALAVGNDGKKAITPQSLATAASTTDGTASAADASKSVAEADLDGDGVLSYDEFLAWVGHANNRHSSKDTGEAKLQGRKIPTRAQRSVPPGLKQYAEQVA